ncbi:MAG: hypothetical protein LBQ01_02435 [Prevotellaceae bacterium]|nr:hypothetical protein [Prevotellaceae bacterium]
MKSFGLPTSVITLFSCGTKRIFAMTMETGLLRLPAGRLVAYPTHKFGQLAV